MARTVINYDKENDIMYISFYNPPMEATHSHREGYIVYRYNLSELIGITIMDYSYLIYHTSEETIIE